MSMTRSVDLAAIDQHVAARIERAISLLRRLCAQPSISATGEGLHPMAKLAAEAMTEYGVLSRVHPIADGPPVVTGEISGRSLRTALLYSHYDVQPVDPLDEWHTPPFEPTRRDGKLFGRGVSDDKGDLVVRLEALDAVRQVCGELPLTLKLVVEGEEESGSPHFGAFVEQHRAWLACDACLMESSGLESCGTAPVILGCKGLLYVDLSVRTAERDAHSGYAPVVPNAAWRLLGALASLRDEEGRVALPGFYDPIRPWTVAELDALRSMPSEEETLRESVGLDAFLGGVSGLAWRERLHGAPTANVCGFQAGYGGAGTKTVIPATAHAKVDFRLVPDQQPGAVRAALRAHLDAQGFADVRIDRADGVGPVRTPPGSPWVQATARVAAEFYGRPAVIVPNASGTMPMATLARALPEVPLFMAPGGPGHWGSRIHAPNEHIRLDDLAAAIRLTARLYLAFGEVADATD
jgi:acetylornithine deacetylase/succinyl-diaminopimelate desuccinylase-like protein